MALMPALGRRAILCRLLFEGRAPDRLVVQSCSSTINRRHVALYDRVMQKVVKALPMPALERRLLQGRAPAH